MSASLTAVISDLHLGGGPDDPGDDHVYQGGQLVQFLGELDRDFSGPMELVINGDFLEFAQAAQGVYNLGSANAWCSEQESIQKLEVIIKGHRDIFDALRSCQSAYRTVTIAPGNHDVDLYWEGVQTKLREVAGPVKFATGKEMLHRHSGRLHIGHGHVYDPANAFKNWAHPFVDAADGKRLEMCPGTLFMVKFVNGLERDYPFADNVKPISQLARLLLREGPACWKPVAWSIMRFVARHPLYTLEKVEKTPDVRLWVSQTFSVDKDFQRQLLDLYRRTVDPEATVENFSKVLGSDDSLADFVATLAIALSPDQWKPCFDRLEPQTLGVARSALKDEKNVLKAEAEFLLQARADVVVFGHTHQPDEYRPSADKAYLNPGSWTRYVELDRLNSSLTVEDLRNEAAFPYALNWVRVEETPSGALHAELCTFERTEAAF